MNFSEVAPSIFVGSHPENCDDIDRLRRELGVSAVLNLQTDEDLERLECNWPQLRAHYRRSKMVVRRVPVRDYDSDDLRKHLPECVQTLHELIRDDHIVYVHCTAGLALAERRGHLPQLGPAVRPGQGGTPRGGVPPVFAQRGRDPTGERRSIG